MSNSAQKRPHSIKVPRLYKVAAKIAEKVKQGGSLKQLVYEKKHPNIKALYALIAETLQHEPHLNQILEDTQLLVKEPKLNPWLARVFITELLWGKKHLPADSKPIQTVLNYHENFLKHADASNESPKKKKDPKPRYVRVNTLKAAVEEVVDGFKAEEWKLLSQSNPNDYQEFLEIIASLKEDEFIVDFHIKELLVFPPNTPFYEHEYYLNGSIVLQDKASCLASFLLNPTSKSKVLDMCAAPGMKTTHLAAIMNNQGTIYAVENNSNRFKTLTELVQSVGATCVHPINKDVLTITEKDCPNVEYILVDPSCTGSGIQDRIKFDYNENESRIKQLVKFQAKILRYALTNFAKAKRVVYSTCSLNSKENEEVVQQALRHCPGFKLVTPDLNNSWYNYGSKRYKKIGIHCLYARPESDYTNGFFVAVFERLKEGEENVLYQEVYQEKAVEQEYGRNEDEATGGEQIKREYKKKKDGHMVEDINTVDFKRNKNIIFKDIREEGQTSSKSKKHKNPNVEMENNIQKVEIKTHKSKKLVTVLSESGQQNESMNKKHKKQGEEVNDEPKADQKSKKSSFEDSEEGQLMKPRKRKKRDVEVEENSTQEKINPENIKKHKKHKNSNVEMENNKQEDENKKHKSKKLGNTLAESGQQNEYTSLKESKKHKKQDEEINDEPKADQKSKKSSFEDCEEEQLMKPRKHKKRDVQVEENNTQGEVNPDNIKKHKVHKKQNRNISDDFECDEEKLGKIKKPIFKDIDEGQPEKEYQKPNKSKKNKQIESNEQNESNISKKSNKHRKQDEEPNNEPKYNVEEVSDSKGKHKQRKKEHIDEDRKSKSGSVRTIELSGNDKPKKKQKKIDAEVNNDVQEETKMKKSKKNKNWKRN